MKHIIVLLVCVLLTVTAPASESYYGSGSQHIKSVLQHGEIVVLDDGSIWRVNRLDRFVSRLWNKYDNVVVVFGSYGSVTLVNSDARETVDAKFLGKY